MSDNENIQTLKPLYRQNKSIIFKGKEYPINFELFQCHSNYFYEFSKDFENDHDILIFEEFSDISEETFSQFVLACQSEKFSITISNIIELHHLSIEYDVPHLKNLTNDIIEEHRDELIFKIIKYKYSKIRNNENKEKDVKYSLDLKMEEEIIAIHFFEYIKQDEFYELPIEFIYRVMNSERMKKEMNEEEEDEFEEFLMKSLNIYGREASILFTKVNFNNTTKSIKFIQRIIQEYSELIDFHMINPIFIMKTSLGIFDKYSELSKEHERIKEENKGLLKKLEYQTNELSEYAIKEKEQSEEKIKLERNNKEQTKEIELLKNENNQLKEFLNEAKTKEYIFQKLVMTSKINEFNELPVKFQSVIVKEMKKLPDIEIDTLEVIEKIERLLLYLSMNDLEEESGIHLMNETSDEMKDVKTISRVTILSTCTKNLFNHKKLNTSEMKEIIEELPFVNFEMKYPSSSFESIYDETKDLKGTCRDKMCMTIFISNIDKTDLHFRNDKNITSIRLDDTVHVIIGYFNGGSFSGCSSLTQIAIPSSVTSIGDSAFSGCSSLTQITIPSSVTSIGSSAFSGCSSLTQITIPSSVTSIGSSAFSGCSSLTQITIPSSVTSIGDSAFSGCSSLTQITIPSSVTSIGDSAFSGCSSLTQISIPSSVTSIGFCAFNGCSSLTQITIPSSVTSIGSFAFSECSSLTQITIPSSVTSIGDYVFNDCPKLNKITIVPNNKKIIDYLENKFLVLKTNVESETYESLVWVKQNINTITIPSFIKNICTGVFNGCSSLTQITIPSSVTSIGSETFSECSSLTQISIPSSVTEVGFHAFSECSSLTQITIPSSVTSIGSCAFSGCSSLTQITIPSSVTSIGDYVFSNCPKLNKITIVPNNKKIIDYLENKFLVLKTNVESETYESLVWVKQNINTITIPSFIKNICTSVFYGCSSLTQITIPSSVTSIGREAFSRCSSLTQISIPSSVTSIGDSAFSGCSSLTQITIPSSVTSIGSSAFSECSSLRQITILSSATSIGSWAFRGCSSLTQITIPSSVTEIGNETFRGCSSLTQITIPSSVTSIGWDAFSGCSSLTQITIPSSVTSIGSCAFRGCSSLTQITIPSSVTSIGSSAFSGCSSLTQITIPSSVTSIGSSAFSECSSLTQITIPSSVTSIGSCAFRGCSSLTQISIPSSLFHTKDSLGILSKTKVTTF